MSTACENCERTSPASAIPLGQRTTSGVRVPPSHV